MIAGVKDAYKVAPEYKGVLQFACLTGLRPAEVFVSMQLSNDGYYNEMNGTLEHYKFPDSFIRTKKKAYLSVMTAELLEIKKRHNKNLSYNTFRLAMRRRVVPMNMAYCRKIFGTHLKKQGIDDELIDLLQGHLSKSVFSRHYFRPEFTREMDKVRKVGGLSAVIR